jgi:hypothetical protein
MSKNNKHPVPFFENTDLIAELETNIAYARLYSNNIFHIYFFSGSLVDMDFIKEINDFNISLGGRTHLNLYEFEPHVDLDPKVREWAAAEDGNIFTIADALVINSLGHKILADFYIKFNKPVKPTKLFSKQAKAISWLLSNV